MSSIESHPPKKGSTRARYLARWRDDQGKQQKRVFDRRQDASDFLVTVEHQVLTGDYVDHSAGRVRLQDYLEEWRKAQAHRDSTRAQVETFLRVHVYPTLGQHRLSALRPSHVQAWVTGLTDTLAPSTVETVYRHLSAAMKAAVNDRLIGRSPCEGVKLPKKEKKHAQAPTVEQVMAIRSGMAPRYRALVLLASGTGLRLGEALGLTVDRVDFLRRTITVDRQLITPNKGKPVFGPPKTPSSNRVVPVAEPVLVELAEHLRLYPALGDDAGEFAGLIFHTELDAPIRRSTFHPMWGRATKAATVSLTELAEGVEPEELAAEEMKVAAATASVTFHQLRHFYASALIASGCSVVAVQHALGHSTPTETLNTYSHLWPTDEDRTRDAISAILGTTCAMGVPWSASGR